MGMRKLYHMWSHVLNLLSADEAVLDTSGTIDAQYEFSKISTGFKLSPASIDMCIDWQAY